MRIGEINRLNPLLSLPALVHRCLHKDWGNTAEPGFITMSLQSIRGEDND